ncbi:MAG: hypothetical protein RLP02_15105 [Coleofasciculus sp. C2-GNP5-27]
MSKLRFYDWTIPPIYFYIPQPYWQDNFPDRADENWQGFGLGIYA